jgi:hypothetical protein
MGEKNLWFRALQGALEDLDGASSDLETPRQKELARDRAAAWFKSRRQEVGSLHFICNSIGMDTRFVMGIVKRIERERQVRLTQQTEAARAARPVGFWQQRRAN